MDRPITGFFQDEAGDWVARLSCGHRQHVRHQPPFVERPWTTTKEGRDGFLGEVLPCAACDRLELPEDAVRYKSTMVFTELTIPKALKKEHQTKVGNWGRIVILEGKLIYEILSPDPLMMTLDPERSGIVPPEVPHRVEKSGRVIFRIDFLSVPEAGSGS